MKTTFVLTAFGTALVLGACAPTATVPGTPDANGLVQCKPGDYQEYVGRQRSTIPEVPQGRIFRVACTTCPVTMDYRDNRVTFAFEESTGIIRRVTCG